MPVKAASQDDPSQPILRRFTVRARNQGGMKTVLDFAEAGSFATDEAAGPGGAKPSGPTPLQAVLGALCGCESVTFHRTAAEMGFAYSGIEFEGSGTIDIRGRMGVRSVRRHFQTVRVEAVVHTREGDERLRAVVEETERRCPVFNLLADAGVEVEMVWTRTPQGDRE